MLIDIHYIVQKGQSTDFEALKWWNAGVEMKPTRVLNLHLTNPFTIWEPRDQEIGEF